MSTTQLILFTADQARRLTDEVKTDAAALWAKLLRLYEGGAHTALGYTSWGAYCDAEFDMGQSRAYQLLDAGRAVAKLPYSTIGGTPPNERVARELVPLLDEPEVMREVWSEAVEQHGPQPTAAHVREHVEPRRNGNMAVHYSSATDEWSTPQDLFDAVDAEFRFDLDVCASSSSAKCERYFAEEHDGLAQEWEGVCWMNPPYGTEIVRWVEKAWESGQKGATVVCLVPARVDTGWWWDYCRFGEIRFIRGRLKFGDSDTSAPFPSALVIFDRPARVVWWER